jgi:hypothetical protein
MHSVPGIVASVPDVGSENIRKPKMKAKEIMYTRQTQKLEVSKMSTTATKTTTTTRQ